MSNESQPQMWTLDTVENLIAFAQDGMKRICDAHNAALAAEREKQQATAFSLGRCEIELRESHRQLLQAQAAIAKSKHLIKDFSPDSIAGRSVGDIEDVLESIDFSALDKHDTAARKRLVDALQWIIENGEEGTSIVSKAKEALK